MRKAFMLCVLAAALTSCGIGRTEQTAALPAASQTAEHTITKPISAATSATKEKGKTSVSSIITKASESKKSTRSTTKSAAQTVSETIKADTSHTTARSSVRHEPTTLTPKSVTDSRQTVTSASKARTAERAAAAAEKPKAVTTVKTSAKPEKSMDTKVTAKTKNTANEEEIIYVEIENVTSLETMTKELENSSTPPSYYERIGKELANDGTDYGKARAVYNWMIENGHGSCVYYSMETYFVCKGVGLECAYGFATDNDWYGHTYSVVKVDGIWYVMDTQGRIFLDNINYCTRMFDGNDTDIPRFKEDIWYDYDENGEYRDWTIE